MLHGITLEWHIKISVGLVVRPGTKKDKFVNKSGQ